jgi:hypothetical protein
MRRWFVILKQVQDNERIALRISGNYCVIHEIAFACNVGFVLRFCALIPQYLRDRLFEYVEPQSGFWARQTNCEMLR